MQRIIKKLRQYLRARFKWYSKKNVGPFTYSDGRLEELLFNLMK